jgi:predicted ATPase
MFVFSFGDMGSHTLLIDALNLVSVGKGPLTSSLGLVVVEISLEAGSIGIAPQAFDHLASAPVTHVLFSCLKENESSLSFLAPLNPGAGVNVLVDVLHDTFTVSLATLPVAVVHANTGVGLFSNSVLLVA